MSAHPRREQFARGEREWLGPLEYIGFVVGDVKIAMAQLQAAGYRFAPIVTPTVHIRRHGASVESLDVEYVVAGGPLPRLKLVGEVPGTYWVQDQPGQPWHHLTYWVDDLQVAAERLIDAGFEPDADGLAADGSLLYRFLRNQDGLRIELGPRANRDRFETWAAQA